VQHRQAGVAERLEDLALHRGQVHQAHAQVRALGPVAVAAEDGHLVPALDQAAADLLDGGLEPPVLRRHSSSADQRDPHVSPGSSSTPGAAT
jgi:hypothetical protein